MLEFDLIDALRQALPEDGAGVLLGVGDDAALLEPPAGQALVACTDTLNEGVHFLPGDDPISLGHKALAVNLSDLAAMGGEPHWALLNLSLPGAERDWLAGFAEGFAALARGHGVSLVGGDTTRGPRSMTVTVLGAVPPGHALRRDGARVGDGIFLSGVPGMAALGLRQRLAGEAVTETARKALLYPTPRVDLGKALRPFATSCIDVSDGLLADLGHITRLSGCGASVSLDALPVTGGLEPLSEEARWDLQLQGGDEYELCFTASLSERPAIDALARSLDLPLTEIGRITGGRGVVLVDPNGQTFQPRRPGWAHFEDIST